MSLIARIASLTNRDRITAVGMTLTAVWLFLVALFWLLAPGGTGSGGVARLVAIMGVVLPVALVWLGVSLARQLAILRAEAEDLRTSLSRMRGGEGSSRIRIARTEPVVSDTPEPAAARAGSDWPEFPQPESLRPESPRLESPRAEAPRTETARAPRTTTATTVVVRPRPADPAPPAPEAGAEQTDPATLIRALNFPDGPDDIDAIEALRHALRDPAHSRVLRAAQDVVTLMAGRDIYMDDLPPQSARPEVWRRFAQGERGSAVAALGGIHHPEALETAAAMMRDDEIFRDTAQHFLRHFDGLAARLVPHLDDLQIAVLADSRTARAFMLIGRVSGTFG